MAADWSGTPVAPSILRGLVKDDPFARAYTGADTARMPAHLATSFERYLAARLTVGVARPEEIHAWLRLCRYAHDQETFGREDVWVHPEDFERTRVGDCEDHALWAWVQYVRLGWNARFAAGLHKGGGHAWVILYRGGVARVYESTAKAEGYEPQDARSCPQYEPVWSVNGELRFFWHGPKKDLGAAPDIVFLD